MITITQPAVSQNIQISSFSMNRDGLNQWVAQIIFSIRSDDGEFIGSKTITISVDKWNDFWANFNSGTFLYQQYDPSAVEQEGDFVNK